MRHLLLGCLAFIIAFPLDLVALKGIPYLKQAIRLIFTFLLGCPLKICLNTEKLQLPDWLSQAGWLLLFDGFLLI